MIAPFRHPPQISKEYADTTWQVLEDAIHKIHNHNSSRLSFEELYRSIQSLLGILGVTEMAVQECVQHGVASLWGAAVQRTDADAT